MKRSELEKKVFQWNTITTVHWLMYFPRKLKTTVKDIKTNTNSTYVYILINFRIYLLYRYQVACYLNTHMKSERSFRQSDIHKYLHVSKLRVAYIPNQTCSNKTQCHVKTRRCALFYCCVLILIFNNRC